ITYAAPSTTVREIAEIMKEDDVGAVIIVESGLPKGIVTDRDLVLRCLAGDLDPQVTAVERVMTKAVETVTLEEGIYDVARKMKLAQVMRIVVVDSAGNAAGLLSFDDVFDLLSTELNDLRETVSPRMVKIIEQAA